MDGIAVFKEIYMYYGIGGHVLSVVALSNSMYAFIYIYIYEL